MQTPDDTVPTRRLLRSLEPSTRHLHIGNPPPDAATVPATHLLQESTLADHVESAAQRLDTPDPRVAASQWSKWYTHATLPPLLAALTLRGVGLDTSPEHVTLVLHDGWPAGMALHPRAPHRVAPERLPEEMVPPAEVTTGTLEAVRAHAVGAALRHHTTVVRRLHQVTGLPEDVLWGNVASRIAHTLHRFASQGGASQRRALADHDAILDARNAPGLPGPNPLRSHMHRVNPDPATPSPEAFARRTCCLRHRLPEKEPCATCPRLQPPPGDAASPR